MPSAKQGSCGYHFLKVFWYDSTRGMNPRSTDCDEDALTTTLYYKRRLVPNLSKGFDWCLILNGFNSFQNQKVALSCAFRNHYSKSIRSVTSKFWKLSATVIAYQLSVSHIQPRSYTFIVLFWQTYILSK